ncbi:branched-chain amino acid ABC transporter permease [Pusillimonas sp.]|uniref:branched-chain amino acid ABC transporter permease n=1 Tax=Pusillimonas sp. TaxID=3040095 RepID=UPI0037CBF0E7
MLLFLVSVGLSITLGVMHFVNLAHGAFALVGGFAAGLLMQRTGMGFFPAAASAFFVAALVGCIAERGLFRRFYRSGPLAQVLVSIGVVFLTVGAATIAFGPAMQPFQLPPFLQGSLSIDGYELGRYRLMLVCCGVLIYLGLTGVLKTRLGAMVRACVDNQRVSAALGLPVDAVFMFTFALGCGLAGLGGALGLGMLGMDAAFPFKYMIHFLMVVCVGGAGTISGPFLAALLIGIVDVGGKYYVPQFGGFLIYAFMVAVLLLRPNGLIPRKGL